MKTRAKEGISDSYLLHVFKTKKNFYFTFLKKINIVDYQTNIFPT